MTFVFEMPTKKEKEPEPDFFLEVNRRYGQQAIIYDNKHKPLGWVTIPKNMEMVRVLIQLLKDKGFTEQEIIYTTKKVFGGIDV
jgi:hypothetical protein